MRFPYLRYERAATSAGIAASAVYRPVVPCRLRGATGEISLFGLVDTGSDTTLLPLFVAERIGVTLDEETGKYRGVGGQVVTVSYGVVQLEIDDGAESLAWSARVAFLDNRTTALLGQSGFLEKFDATFFGADRQLELKQVPTALT